MKRNLILAGCIFGVLAFATCAARAAEPQVVTITVLPKPTPKPVYRLDDNLPTYKLDSSDVKRIAKLLWSSPLRSESEKTKLIWVVLNRVDEGGIFGNSVHDVINDKEFTFYDRHARVSDRTRELVENVMQLWKAEKDGYHIGARPPKNALYVRFGGDGNKVIQLLEEPSGKAIDY